MQESWLGSVKEIGPLGNRAYILQFLICSTNCIQFRNGGSFIHAFSYLQQTLSICLNRACFSDHCDKVFHEKNLKFQLKTYPKIQMFRSSQWPSWSESNQA